MRNYLLFICVSLVAFLGYAQPPLNINEQFDDNRWMWETVNDRSDGELFANVENGHYILKNLRKDGGSRFFWKKIFIDETQNFIIEARVKETSNGSNRFGLVWNAEGWKNSNFFCISGNQYYVISQYIDGEFKDVIKWNKDTSIVRPSGEYNDLMIQKIGQNLLFYVNNNQVYKTTYQPFKGNNIGFFLSKGISGEVDYLKVYQYGDARINLIDNPINGYVKENLGDNINGEKSDRSPVISPDGKTLYYIKEGYPFIEGEDRGSEVYVSTYNEENNSWSKAENIGAPINNLANNSVIGVSADNQTLIVSKTYNTDGTSKGGGMSITNRTANGWEVPREIVIQNYKNKNKYAQFCMAADNNVLLMCIEMEDSRGDLDLYVSFKQEDGTYSTPKNVGDVINTKYQDGTVFIASDNKTIYFSSAGHPGYGSNDIFMSERLDDTWLNWSKPKNLGPEINSDGWDAYFTVPGNGEYAYLVTSDSKISKGSEDIIRVKLAESAKPKPIMIVRGKVINAKTNEFISGSSIVYEDLEQGIQLGTALSDKTNGSYQIALPSEKKYGFLAEKEGFYAVSDNLDLIGLGRYGEIEKNLYLHPIEKNEIIRLNNIFFDVDKSDLRKESDAEMNRLISFLNNNPSIKIKIEGHTDSQGSAPYNLKLSNERAKSVMNYLITKGINQARLSFEGFGLTKPIASNDTDEGKQKNRRVEFRIIEK